MRLILFFLFFFTNVQSQTYYVYVAAESEDTVSLIKFTGDNDKAEEIERINVGSLPTEIEGPHGITVDPNGKYWYLSLPRAEGRFSSRFLIP